MSLVRDLFQVQLAQPGTAFCLRCEVSRRAITDGIGVWSKDVTVLIHFLLSSCCLRVAIIGTQWCHCIGLLLLLLLLNWLWLEHLPRVDLEKTSQAFSRIKHVLLAGQVRTGLMRLGDKANTCRCHQFMSDAFSSTATILLGLHTSIK